MRRVRRTGRAGCGHVIALGHDRPISTGSARLGGHSPMKRLRDWPIEHRISGGTEGLESGQQRQVVLDARLGEAQARVDDNALRLYAGGQHTVDLAHEFVVYVGQYTVLVDGGVLIGVRALGAGGQPRQCCTMYRQSWSATTCGSSASSVPPETSLIIWAPSLSAAAATDARVVSMDNMAPAESMS